MTELVVIHRYGCHLCDEMLERLRQLQAARRFVLRVEDIDADTALLQRYDEAVPVLMINGEEICRYVLDEARLQQYLNSG